MTLKEWRIDMQKVLLEVEKVENHKKPELPDPVVNDFLNLYRDFVTMTRLGRK